MENKSSMDMGVIDQDCCSSGTITVQLFLIYFITKPWGMAREDKNKDGSPRRGSHQRNPAFIRGQKRKKSDYSLAGDWPSELQQQRSDHDGDGKKLHPGERRFNLVVDNVPYLVKAAPFTFNGEIRYRVRFNESSEHVFTWDSSLGQLRAIDDDASTMPDNVEIAISEKLQSKT